MIAKLVNISHHASKYQCCKACNMQSMHQSNLTCIHSEACNDLGTVFWQRNPAVHRKLTKLINEWAATLLCNKWNYQTTTTQHKLCSEQYIQIIYYHQHNAMRILFHKWNSRNEKRHLVSQSCTKSFTSTHIHTQKMPHLQLNIRYVNSGTVVAINLIIKTNSGSLNISFTNLA